VAGKWGDSVVRSNLGILYLVYHHCLSFASRCDFIFRTFSAVVCPRLTVPDNGGVVPASCSQTDVEYGTRCVFYCGDGYALSGPRYTTCQDDTSWSEIGALSCVRGKKYSQAVREDYDRPLCFVLRASFWAFFILTWNLTACGLKKAYCLLMLNFSSIRLSWVKVKSTKLILIGHLMAVSC